MAGNYEGLNFIPMLPRSTMFTRGNVIKRRPNTFLQGNSPRARDLTTEEDVIVSYNGNYEGDASMFGGYEYDSRMLQSNELCLTNESDNEYIEEMERCQREAKAKGPAMRLWNHFKIWLLTEQRLNQLNQYTDRLQANFFYQQTMRGLRFSVSALLLVLRCLLLVLAYITTWTYGLWRSKTLLRQAARRLLWSMTLAKCEDGAFFGLILLASPLLFVISIVGFVLSMYCTVKNCLKRCESFIRDRSI